MLPVWQTSVWPAAQVVREVPATVGYLANAACMKGPEVILLSVGDRELPEPSVSCNPSRDTTC